MTDGATIPEKKTKVERNKSILIPDVTELTEETPSENVAEEYTEIEFGLKKPGKSPTKKTEPKNKNKGPEETQLSLF